MSESIHSAIWSEAPDARSPFVGRDVRLCGYDYYGDLLAGASWIEVVWLLFRGEAPSRDQARLLGELAVMLADPGPREPSVHAAMCGGIGGSRDAASLMAALAVAGGDAGGCGELRRAIAALEAGGPGGESLADALTAHGGPCGTWPGFSPASAHAPEGVLRALAHLCRSPLAHRLRQLERLAREVDGRAGLALIGVAAAAFCDLHLGAHRAEALFLIFRLPGALAHAHEQFGRSHKEFPFFRLALKDPATETAR